MVSKEISSYEYYTFSSIPRAGTNFVQTSVLLYGNGGDYLGAAIFCAQETAPLLAPELGTDGVIRLFYTVREFPTVIDMLRNEKPVYLIYDGQVSRVSTSLEPVGEGELTV